MAMKQTFYGLLDDEDKIIRWTECKPRHDDYVVKTVKLERKKRVSAYEIAVRACGYSDY